MQNANYSIVTHSKPIVTSDQLVMWRRRLQLSQTDLAMHLDVSNASVSRWEHPTKGKPPGWVALALMGLERHLHAPQGDLAHLDSLRFPTAQGV